VTGQWFFPGTPVSSINKTNRHDITEILLKMVLSTITLTLTNKIKLQLNPVIMKLNVLFLWIT